MLQKSTSTIGLHSCKCRIDPCKVTGELLKAGEWVLDAEYDVLTKLVEKHSNYTLTFTGHPLTFMLPVYMATF